MQDKPRSVGFILLIVLSQWMLACSSLPPVPVNRYYHLPVPDTKSVSSDKALYKSILVRRPVVSGIYNERAILNVMATRPLELHRYHYHMWSQAPAMLVHDNVARFMRVSGVASTVSRQGSGSKADLIISSRILRFEQIKLATESHALVHMEFSIHSNGKTLLREYEAKVKAASTDIHALVEAFGSALDQVNIKLLKTLMEPVK